MKLKKRITGSKSLPSDLEGLQRVLHEKEAERAAQQTQVDDLKVQTSQNMKYGL